MSSALLAYNYEKHASSFEDELEMRINSGSAVKLPVRGINIETNRTKYVYDECGKIVDKHPEILALEFPNNPEPKTYYIHRGFALVFDDNSEPYLISLSGITGDFLSDYGLKPHEYTVPFSGGLFTDYFDTPGFPEIIQFVYREEYKRCIRKNEQFLYLQKKLDIPIENLFTTNIQNPDIKKPASINYQLFPCNDKSSQNLILITDSQGYAIVKGDLRTINKIEKRLGYLNAQPDKILAKEVLDSGEASFWLKTQQKIDPEFYQAVLELKNSPLAAIENPQTPLNIAEKEQISTPEQNKFTVFANLLTLLDRAVGGIGQFLEIKELIGKISSEKEIIKSKQDRLNKAKTKRLFGNNEKKKLERQITEKKQQIESDQISIDLKKEALNKILTQDANLVTFLNQNENALTATFGLSHVGQIEISRLLDLKLAMLREDWHEVKGSFQLGDDNLVHIQPFNLGYAIIETDSKESGDPEDIIPTTATVVFSGEDLIQEFVRFGQFIVEGEYEDDLKTVSRSIYPENLAVDRKDIGKSVRVDADILDTIRSPILKKFIQDVVLKLKIDTQDQDWSLEIILEPYDQYLESEGSHRVAKIITHYAKENSLTNTTNQF